MENNQNISALLEKMDCLISLIEKDHEYLNKMISKMDDDELESNWIGTADAARLLGLRVPKRGRRYVGTMKYLRENGFIKKFRESKPIMYWRPEIEKVATRISEGEIEIPSLP